MPVLRINAHGKTPTLHGEGQPLRPVLENIVKNPGPIVVMLHGYKFQPHHKQHCPHNHIFASHDVACRKATSWPTHLGMSGPNTHEGVAIAFGWNARGNVWQAHQKARDAAIALATLIGMIRKSTPRKKVHILAHSMGGYVALRSVAKLESGDLGRILLLNGALYQSQMAKALRTPAGRSAEIFNVVSRENALYDTIFENLLWPEQNGDRSVGRALAKDQTRTITIDLSDKNTLIKISDLGFSIAPRQWIYCHWSTYLRDGVFPFYQALIRHPDQLSMTLLKSKLSPWLAPSEPSLLHSRLNGISVLNA